MLPALLGQLLLNTKDKPVLHSAVQDPAWCQAMTLTERLALLRSDQIGINSSQTNSNLADQRCQRWRSQTPLVAESIFAKRLATNKMTSDEFLCLLGEPAEVIHQRLPHPPRWLTEIAQAYSRTGTAIGGETLAQILPNKSVLGFLALIEPLIRRAHKGLHDGVQELVGKYPELPFHPENVETIFLSSLPRALITLLGRTMTLEVNVARMMGQLEGETSAARFDSFISRLRQPEIALAIMREYPVLARQIVIRINSWLDVTLEFLQRLCADWADIRSNFTPDQDPGLMIQAEAGMSDSHRGGHSVFILTFSSGFKLVYKPKSLGIDIHFQELLTWLNQRSDSCAFSTFKIIDRGAYGWTEFIKTSDCASVDELKRFYQRQGMYLALLYALEATDFHYENLIAAGEYPTPIDLESLFHARTEALDPAEGRAAYHAMDQSVLRVGLMPQRLWISGDEGGVDLSGIGGSPGQMTPHEVPYLEDAGTDQIRLIRKRMEMNGGQNRPMLNGKDINPLDYRQQIIDGFTSIYRLMMQHRGELLAADGPLARFANDEVRYIIRPTRTYSVLLTESFHPDVLRNALDRDRFFDRLWLGAEERPYLSKVIAAEIEDLQRGDIPIFTTSPNSRDIWTSANERIPDFLNQSGLTLVRQRIEQLSNNDLEQQLWFINASLMTLDVASDGARWGAYELIKPRTQATDKQLTDAACAIGDRLESLAKVSDDDVSWVGVALLNEKHWSLMPMGVDLYNGLPGIALFLAYLGATTGIDRYTSLAKKTIDAIRRSPRHLTAIKSSIGGFTGLGGWIFVLTHLSQLWKQPELLAEAESMVELLPRMIEKDEQLDFLSGAAGLISVMAGLHRCAPSERTRSVAIQCGDHLLARAQNMDHGIGWATAMSERPLAGFSHGTAGIAYALLSLAELSGEERFREAALKGMAYERSIFSSKMSNWPDLRKLTGPGAPSEGDQEALHSMFAWCHGAPGVGLARLCGLDYMDDEATREEIEVSLNATLSKGFGRNHSLCHGDLGNIEMLLRAGRMLGDMDWDSHARHVASIVLDSINRHGCLCGIPMGVESPGLMTGLAGIGFGLLRIAKPDEVPSPLVLDPPNAI
jgi:type 2 lantibiotic biosynthesis protein LanM